MRACGLAIVRHALEHGFIGWQGGVPRLLLSRDEITAHALRPHWQTIQAVLRRASAFRRQLTAPGTEPFVRFRDPRWTAEGCPSCGGKVGEHEFLRCDLCTLGAGLALAAPEEAEQLARGVEAG